MVQFCTYCTEKLYIRTATQNTVRTYVRVQKNASLLSNPVPRSPEFHLQKAVRAFDSRIPQLTRLIASALALDAFPPGMHRKSDPLCSMSPVLTFKTDFCPKDVFYAIYKPIIGQLRIALATETFLSQVESTFTTLVLKNRKHKLKAATSHAHCLRLIGSAAADIELTGTCVFCLLRRPIFTLDCQHQLCSCCITASGAAFQNHICSLSTCPWCGKANTRLFSLQPPTAGPRILDLGPSSDLTKTCVFLKDLQRNTIPALPLRDYFDIVRCDSTSGLLLVLSLFVEEWSLDDAAYHVRRATKTRVHQGLITFGPHLTWPFRALQRANGTKVVHHQLDSAPDENLLQRSSIIRYDASLCRHDAINSISNGILADFFYVKLVDQPCLASSPEICLLRLECHNLFPKTLDRFSN
jgi:hypothetical protein